ncbi:transcription termination factor 4, mitochondrial isoform X1 [Spea bombifrons]|uniref:transcription termination factor 4, mitochondrial isoform X1 n=1 Tax=Spea bombifrons TaxID=233779 RepID=UPI00234BD1FA|nr:transcription termination factor 4, mitochondrial isoform X1 [Spea bombifrons]
MFWGIPYLILRRLRSRLEPREPRYEPVHYEQRPIRENNRRQSLRRRRQRIFPVRVNLSEINEHDIKSRYHLSSDAIMSLYELIKDDLISTTKRSNAVPGIVKLLCALHYFASGSLQSTVAEVGGITQSTFSRALSEVISAILKLADKFINYPNDDASLERIKDGFLSIAGFPNVVGAIGCAHVALSPPAEIEQIYRNRMHYHSINVQVVCDSNMNILDVVSQFPGSTRNSYILRQSGIHERFESGDFNGGWLLGESSYGVKSWLLTPVCNPATNAEAEYNSAHRATHCVVEHTFGVLKSRFRCLDHSGGAFLYSPEKVCKIIVVCCILHNIAIMKNNTIDVAQDLRPNDQNEDQMEDGNTIEGKAQRERVIKEFFTA